MKGPKGTLSTQISDESVFDLILTSKYYTEGYRHIDYSEFYTNFIRSNVIAEIHGAKVVKSDDLIVLIDISKINNEEILRFLQTLKHGEPLINVAFLTEGEWESFSNFLEILHSEEIQYRD